MQSFAPLRPLAGLALLAALTCTSVIAQDDHDDRDNREIKHVFVIAMENHNWTQPATLAGKIQPIFQNPNAPFINSLVNGTAVAFINGRQVNISRHVSYATSYHNVLATQSGNNPHIHPSEPNYLWAEAGTNFGIANDDDPYKDTPPNAQTTTQHLSGLLQKAGRSWKSYQEDIDLQTVNGKLTNLPLPENQWTVPLVSLSGAFATGSLLNQYNDSLQYNYAVKHNPMAFFADTNGGNNTTTSNPLRFNYAPLQQLQFDLANNRIADYTWITPDQFNEQHSALSAGFAGLTGDSSQIKAGDNALARLVPMIMASKAYQDGGAIILWWDESEDDGETNDNPDDFSHTIPEIVISNLAHSNENGVPYASPVDFTHSSDLRTMQNIFHVKATGGSSPYLGDAANVNDLSDLFEPGVIPSRP
ncbi:MAG: alkaline phosphatase family protein [Terracidiphilus sp.]